MEDEGEREQERWRVSDQDAGLTSVKGGRREEGLGRKPLGLWCSSEKVTARLMGALERRWPVRGVPHWAGTPNYTVPQCARS